MITDKKTEILKQIDELTPDDIVKKAVETAENSIENSIENATKKNTEEGPADKDHEDAEEKESKEKEEPDNEDAENPTDEAVKDIINNLTPEEKEEYKEQMKNAEINAAEQFASKENAAKLLEAQYKAEAEDMTKNGGKKKSKGKK